MDTDKQLRAALIQSALEKSQDIKEVLPTVQAWLELINTGNVSKSLPIPANALPSSTQKKTPIRVMLKAKAKVVKVKKAEKVKTKAKAKTKATPAPTPTRAPIKRVANGGARWTEDHIEKLNKVLAGKKITSELITKAAEITGRSRKSIRGRMHKMYPGETIIKTAIKNATTAAKPDRFANARAAKAAKAAKAAEAAQNATTA